MSRAATTTDAFNAVGDQTRRDVLDALAVRESTVSELTQRLDYPQPQVSKHLKVLREVSLVTYRRSGRSRVYRLDGTGLKPLRAWLDELTASANEHFDRLDDYLHELQASSNANEQPED